MADSRFSAGMMNEADQPGGFEGGLMARLRRPVIDPVTGRAVLTPRPEPTAADIGAAYVDLIGSRMRDAVTAPRDAIRGDLQVFDPATGHVSDEAMDRANGMAGIAMTGSLPMRAPRGALRSFGGAAEAHADDPLAALSAKLADIQPEVQAGPRMLDPNAKQWDLYHGSGGGKDFDRFDPNVSNNPAERGAVFFAPDAESASGYATGGSGEVGPRVFRTTVEPGKTDVIDIGKLAETDPAFNARARELMLADSPGHGSTFDNFLDSFRASRADDARVMQQMRDMGIEPDPSFGTRMSYGHGHIGAAIERAKAQGLDTAILRGLAEHGGDDQVVALTPNRVRAYYAPDQLLYSGGPLGALPSLAMDAATDDRRAARKK